MESPLVVETIREVTQAGAGAVHLSRLMKTLDPETIFLLPTQTRWKLPPNYFVLQKKCTNFEDICLNLCHLSKIVLVFGYCQLDAKSYESAPMPKVFTTSLQFLSRKRQYNYYKL